MAKRKRNKRADTYRVLGISADQSGVHWDRHRFPLEALGNLRGWECETSQFFLLRNLDRFDLISGMRISTAEMWKVWRGMLHPLAPASVYEVDDDLFNVDPSNDPAAYEFFHRPETREIMANALMISDAVTTSSPVLAERLREYNPFVICLPNRLPANLLRAPVRRDGGPVVIGWAGGSSHRLDVASVAEPLRQVIDGDAVRLKLYGMDYRDILGVPGEFAKWTDSKPAYVRSLDFDIGICPLIDNHFNRGKTAIKAREYASRGIPTVASNVTPYKEEVQHGVTGFLASTAEEWTYYLRLLIEDPDLRHRMGTAAYEHAKTQTLERHIGDRARAYEWVIEDGPAIRAQKLAELAELAHRPELPSLV